MKRKARPNYCTRVRRKACQGIERRRSGGANPAAALSPGDTLSTARRYLTGGARLLSRTQFSPERLNQQEIKSWRCHRTTDNLFHSRSLKSPACLYISMMLPHHVSGLKNLATIAAERQRVSTRSRDRVSNRILPDATTMRQPDCVFQSKSFSTPI